MFNKSIKKIIIMVMSILFLFVIGIVTVIFLSSYIDSKKDMHIAIYMIQII